MILKLNFITVVNRKRAVLIVRGLILIQRALRFFGLRNIDPSLYSFQYVS